MAREFDEAQLEKLAEHSAGGRSLLEILIEDFITRGRDLIIQIKTCGLAGETENMRDFAHSLRSPALTLGLNALAKLCHDLEERSFSKTELAMKFADLERGFSNACAWLRSRPRSRQAS
jgi:HPt (histidine-containing phosphotransfer) domain-containing protein